MLRMLIVALFFIGSMRCLEIELDQQFCKHCQEKAAGGNSGEAPGDQFLYAASIYRHSLFMQQNEHGVEVDRGSNFSIYCSAVIVNPGYALTSYDCSYCSFF